MLCLKQNCDFICLRTHLIQQCVRACATVAAPVTLSRPADPRVQRLDSCRVPQSAFWQSRTTARCWIRVCAALRSICRPVAREMQNTEIFSAGMSSRAPVFSSHTFLCSCWQAAFSSLIRCRSCWTSAWSAAGSLDVVDVADIDWRCLGHLLST